jgi:hypothetical protein
MSASCGRVFIFLGTARRVTQSVRRPNGRGLRDSAIWVRACISGSLGFQAHTFRMPSPFCFKNLEFLRPAPSWRAIGGVSGGSNTGILLSCLRGHTTSLMKGDHLSPGKGSPMNYETVVQLAPALSTPLLERAMATNSFSGGSRGHSKEAEYFAVFRSGSWVGGSWQRRSPRPHDCLVCRYLRTTVESEAAGEYLALAMD